MKDNIVKFRSLTQAIKAQNLLKKLKVKSELERISGKKSTKGCAYQLMFNSDVKYIKNVLKNNNINFIE